MSRSWIEEGEDLKRVLRERKLRALALLCQLQHFSGVSLGLEIHERIMLESRDSTLSVKAVEALAETLAGADGWEIAHEAIDLAEQLSHYWADGAELLGRAGRMLRESIEECGT